DFFGDRAVVQRALKVLAGDAALESGENVAVTVILDNEPHLGFRFPVQLGRDIRGRVDLHGKPLRSVKQLEEQRKTWCGRRVVTEDLCAVFGPEFVQRFAFQCAVVDDALRFFAIDNLPRFADVAGAGKIFAEKRLEPSPAPDAFHKERLEEDRFGEIHKRNDQLPMTNEQHRSKRRIASLNFDPSRSLRSLVISVSYFLN